MCEIEEKGIRRLLYLYIVRHGETEWNAAGRIQGRLDSRLTEKGRRYAAMLGEKLQETEFIRIISSPSSRALQTAKLIKGDRDIPVFQDERIMEMALGPWQGMTLSEIQLQYPKEYEWFTTRPELYQIIGAESFFDMKKRAEDFLSELQNSPFSGNLLIVTHGLFIKILLAVVKGIEIKEIWKEKTVEGTSLSIIKIDGEDISMIVEDDTSHLNERLC